MDKLTNLVKATTIQMGAHVVGIASAEVMNQFANNFQKPEQNLAGAKAVISFGIRMLDSMFETPNIRVHRTSYVYLHGLLDRIAWRLATQLEELGYSSIPIPSAAPVDMMELGGVMGDVSQRHAAVQAGLGKIGLGHNFLHPDFGPRIRLGCVVTTAPLVCDEPIKEDICLGEKCQLCKKKCPTQALGDKFGVKACLSVMHKYNLYGLLKLIGEVLNADDTEEKKKLLYDRRLSEIYMSLRNGDPPMCIKCIEVCPVGRKKVNKDIV